MWEWVGMHGDCENVGWGRLCSFHGDGNNSNFVCGTSSRIPMHPHKIYLHGDAWGNAWGGYALVSEIGVIEQFRIFLNSLIGCFYRVFIPVKMIRG